MIKTLISHCNKLSTFDFADLGSVCFVEGDPKGSLEGFACGKSVINFVKVSKLSDDLCFAKTIGCASA